jgi:hypothetical protein
MVGIVYWGSAPTCVGSVTYYPTKEKPKDANMEPVGLGNTSISTAYKCPKISLDMGTNTSPFLGYQKPQYHYTH